VRHRASPSAAAEPDRGSGPWGAQEGWTRTRARSYLVPGRRDRSCGSGPTKPAADGRERRRPLDAGGQRCESFRIATDPAGDVLGYVDRFGNTVRQVRVEQG